MRKITMLVALVLISAFTFAQQKQKNTELKAVKVLRSINNMTPGAKSVVDSLRYDGDNADGVGTNGAATFGVYSFFPTAYTAAHHTAGNTITSVKVYINGVADVTATTIKIFSDQGVTSLASQVFTAVEGWNEVTLTTPLVIPASDMYIGYELTTTAGYPAGCDGATTPNPNGNWIDFNSTWQHVSELSATLTANWNIRAMVSGTALTTPVAICNPLTWAAGDVISGSSVTSSAFTLQNVGAGTLTVSGITGLSAPYTTTLVPATVNLTAGQSSDFTFTYAPTAAGAANQTVVIATNAGNITIDLTGNGVVCSTLNVPYTEGFEASTACININDANGDSFAWHYWENAAWAHGGTKFARYSYNTDGATAGDDWLILPGINLNAGTTYKVDFWHKVFDNAYPESFQVRVGTAAAPASLTTTIMDRPNQSDTAWTNEIANFTVPTTGVYYVAFYCNSQPDEWRLGVDDVTIDVSNGVAENTQEVVSVFPNPAKDKLFISSSKINTVEIYNLTGAKVASFGNQNVINISDLAQGTYLVKVITDNKVTTKKINIVR